MSSNRARQVEELFHEAAEQPPAERSAFLDAACADDADLRRRVERLLAFDEAPGNAFLDGVREQDPDAGRPAVAGIAIGRYTLMRRIGEGGMGVVYEARQEEPSRLVALKLIRPGLISDSNLRRFRQEAEILGRLQHPGIAQVHEAGMAEVRGAAATLALGDTLPGRSSEAAPVLRIPFLAMEYVRGLPPAEYVAQHGLGTRQCLELVALVCDAVHYAHQKGVIHRDLKPANILVVDELQIADCRFQIGEGPQQPDKSAICNLQSAIPKVLDFGVARLTDSDSQVTTLHTAVGQLIGTVPYMSPEQLSGDAGEVDARSDVYALGAILYQLLTRRCPHDVRNRSLPEAVRIIREEDPPRLSSIKPLLRGDVETIVAKALEKDKLRRYQSAAELAADLRRFLHDEPIVARPATTMYQLRMFAKRNKGLVGGVLAALLALLGGLIGMAFFEARARRQRDRAEHVAYQAGVAAATAALQNHDVATARRQLQKAPPHERGWEWNYLWNRTDDSSLTIAAGPTPVKIAGFSQDGAKLLGVAGAADVLSWNAVDGARDDAPVRNRPQLALSADGSMELSIAGDRTLQVADLAGARSYSISTDALGFDPEARLWSPVCSPDRRWVGVIAVVPEPHAPERHDLVVVELDQGRVSRNSEIRLTNASLILSQVPQACAWSTDENVARLWNPQTGALGTLVGHSSAVLVANFSPDGARIVTAGRDTTVRLWDAATGRELAIGHGHTDMVTCLAFSPNAQLLASAGNDHTIRLWWVGAESLSPAAVLQGHEGEVLGLCFSSDGARLASSSTDKTIRTWDTRRPSERGVLRGHTSYVYPVTISHDGQRIASAAWDFTVRVWDAASQSELTCIAPFCQTPSELLFSPDGSRVTGLGADTLAQGGTAFVRTWDIRSGTALGSMTVPLAATLVGFTGDVAYVLTDATVPQGEVLAWDVAANTTSSKPLAGSAGRARRAFSQDGAWLATRQALAARSALARVIEVATGRVRATSRCGVFAPPAVCAVGGARPKLAITQEQVEHSIVILDGLSGTRLATLEAHTDEVLSLAFSPDGRRLASGGRDQVIRIWDVRTFDEVAQLRGHTSYVWSLAWSDDGALLVSGSGDHTLRLWDARGARERLQSPARTESP